MASLKCRTRGNSSPQGKPRVYFCCHPEDFQKYFETVSDEILAKQNCAVWYTQGAAQYGEDLLADLKQMQLFVMPVTTKLLCSENDAISIEFPFAVENHIPVLPLMQESGLEELFNSKCGDLQFLDKYNTDETAISYDEKLKKYLDSVLVGDELAEKIRAAFDAYIFLSYRKKDRRYAQELMRLIHKNEFCRDIAIWYDEFLTPGENFNDSIKEALQKSGLFVLAVTPNLINEPNYIMTTEYPMAREAGKPILPAELVPTDRSGLSEKYADIPAPTDAYNEEALSEAMLRVLKQIAIRENDSSPEHNFFIGLAYLNGIDVEVDHERALSLIAASAESGVTQATGELVSMYRNGIGVPRDYGKAADYQRMLIAQYEKNYEKTDSGEDFSRLFDALTECGRFYISLGMPEEAKKQFDGAKKTAEDRAKRSSSDMLQYGLYVSYDSLGSVLWELGRLEPAIDYYLKGLNILLMLILKSNMNGLKEALCGTYCSLGKAYAALHQFSDALEMYGEALKVARQEKDTEGVAEVTVLIAQLHARQGNVVEALNLYEEARFAYQQLAQESYSDEHIHNLAAIYAAMGKVLESLGQFDQSLQMSEKALEIKTDLAERTNTFRARSSLANTYSDMAIVLIAVNMREKAFEWTQKALQIREELARQSGAVSAKRALAASCNNMAGMLVPVGQIDRALQMFHRVIELRQEIVNSGQNVQDRLELCEAYDNLGNLYRLLKKPDAAKQMFQNAMGILRGISPEEEDAAVSFQRAFSQLNMGILEKDLSCLEKAYQGFAELARKHPDVAEYAGKRDLAQRKIRELTGGQPPSAPKKSLLSRIINVFKK